MRSVLVFGGLLLVLGVSNYAIVQKERLRSGGTSMLVELAPVDPRSLIQGDYMRLDYAIARQLSGMDAWPSAGHIVVALDTGDVARFVRLHDPGTPLAAGAHLLQYRRRGSRVRIGTDAFFFQEGTAAKYNRARYGELRVDRKGGSVLVSLRDAERRPIR